MGEKWDLHRTCKGITWELGKARPAVIWSFGQNDFELSKSSTIYKYLIFIYSEQMTHSENENDHFDLDHFDHICFLFLIDFLGHIGIFIYFCAQNIETHSWR